MGGFQEITISILLICAISQSSKGQSEWQLQHLDKRSGLSNSAINSIYLDRLDHVWFGTWDGLNRYDGDAIVSYNPVAGDNHSLSNNIVRQILEDKNGNLWVVTHDGINKYDRKLDRFDRYLYQINDLPFLENNLQATLSVDGTLYVSLVGWGIGEYSPVTNQFILKEPKNEIFKNMYGLGAYKGFLYLLNKDGGLIAYDHDKQVASLLMTLPLNLGLCRLVGFGGKYYLIYQDDPATLTLKELVNGRIVLSHEIAINNATITTIAPSKDHVFLYVGTDVGELSQLTLSKGTPKLVPLKGLFPSLHRKKLNIFSIHESRHDILWIGTDGDGVYKYLTKKRSFYSIEDGDVSEGKISNSIVRSVLADQNNTLYVGTRNGGLNVIKPNAKTKVYDTSNGLSDNTVLSLAGDTDGNIWVGTDSEGLDMIEKETGKIFHFPRDFKNYSKELYFGSVYKIFFDSYGHIWLGTSGYGIVYLDISKDEKGNYYLDETYSIKPSSGDKNDDIQIKSNIVYAIEEEEPNILWFGTRNGGLYRYNTLTRHFTHNLQSEEKSRVGLSNNDVLSLHIDDKNQLWVGTSGGLNKVNLNEFTVVQYTQKDGLSNNTIHGILEDDEGTLWLSSNKGLFAFDPTNNTFKNFNWNDGLLNYEFTDGAYFRSPNEEKLFFGGTDGLDIVFPALLDRSIDFPRLALTDLLVSNVRIHPGDSSGILPSSIDLQDKIELNYNQNFLSVRFTTLDYWHKQRCEYRYYLENFNKEWIEIGKQSIINLTNIPPGNYILHLNNTNENGDWNPEVRRLAITISPPFWGTKMAYIFYILMALLAQIGLIQFLRSRAKRKKTDAIERIKNEQAEVIQKYKLEFFTNIAHEFRTPLTLILGPAVTLLEQTKTKPALNQSIQSIYRNSLRLQKLIQELIQFRKVELGKEKLKVRSLDLIGFVEELLQSFRQYALDKEIVLTYEGPKTFGARMDSEILEKILINLISNALKYTDHGGEVCLKVWSYENNAHFSVVDTGIGIPSHELTKVFEQFASSSHEVGGQSIKSTGIGLSLTKKLIHLHLGNFKLVSTPGQGTNFTFWLPSQLPDTELQVSDDVDHALFSRLNEHVQVELHHKSNLDQEMINISLERFEYNILLIDDNIQILNLLKDLLSSKYNVIACTSGPEALAVLSYRKIDLVISDVMMPEMDGYAVCETIKSRIETSHIPVILLTAKGEIEDRIEGLKAGADAYIPKPFHPDHLYVRIEKLIKVRDIFKVKFESYALSENEFSSFGIGTKDDEFFKQVDQFIKDEMENQDLDALHIASHVGMSKTSLYTKIRALTGQTPHAMINHYRLKRAAFLLTHSDMNVSEIINKTGFNSRSYFYKSFQDKFNCTPSNYPRD